MNRTTTFRLPPALRLGSFRDTIGFEVSPVRIGPGGHCEVCRMDPPDFWTLYETGPDMLAHAIADFPDETSALAGAVKLGGASSRPDPGSKCDRCLGEGKVAPGLEGAPMERCNFCDGSGLKPVTACGCPAYDYVESVFSDDDLHRADSRCDVCGWPVFYNSGKGARP